jgi:hypothetical protein
MGLKVTAALATRPSRRAPAASERGPGRAPILCCHGMAWAAAENVGAAVHRSVRAVAAGGGRPLGGSSI